MLKTFHGPVGTRLGTFITNNQLDIESKHFPLNQYDKLLVNSINLGLEWLRKNINILNIQKYNNLLTVIERLYTEGCTDSLNQKIIELAYDVLSKVNDLNINPARNTPEIKPKTKLNNHLGAPNLNDISVIDILTDTYVMVQTFPGNFVLCLYVKHNDHYDILPYEYIIKKVPKFSIKL